MKSIVNGKAYNHPATIDDETALAVIKEAVLAVGFGKQEIMFEEDLKQWLNIYFQSVNKISVEFRPWMQIKGNLQSYKFLSKLWAALSLIGSLNFTAFLHECYSRIVSINEGSLKEPKDR